MSKNILLSAAITAITFGSPLFAEDLALILSNPSYRKQLDLRNGQDIDGIERALQDAGFSTITMQNMDLDDTAKRLAGINSRVSNAERLVIVINGHVLSALGGGWMLAPDAGFPNNLTIGTMALPISPLMEAAAKHPGAAVVAVVDQTRRTRFDFGVETGSDAIVAGQGVTLVKGTAGKVRDFFEDGFLAEGRSIAAALNDHPDVTGSGYIPSVSSFLPGTSGPEIEGEIVAEPAPEPEQTPEERYAAAEADLGLTRNERREIQRSLAILGFNPGGIDGLLGRGSRRAITAYQVDRDLDATGYLTGSVIDQLNDEAAKRSRELEEEARERQALADARDTQYWRDTGQAGDEAGLRAYLKRYPDGLYAEIATTRLEVIEEARAPVISRSEKRFWDRVEDTDTEDAYRSYINEYPNGAFVRDAQNRLDEIEAAQRSEADNRQYLAIERSVAGNSVARKLVENRLAALGLDPGRVDGTFDEKTREALRRFQRARNLEPTGYVNQATMVRILVGK